jgi:hypothetical protein
VGVVRILFVLRYRVISAPARVREAALREWRESAAALRKAQVRCARATRAVEAADAHRAEGAASIAEFAERNGVSAYEARMLSGLGRALESEPALVADVVSGAIPVASAAVVGDVFSNPALRKPGDDWVGWARTQPTSHLRRLYWMRRDEVLQGAAVVEVVARVKPHVRDDLARSADLASRSARASLTLGQTLEVLAREYLDRHDPLRRKAGRRRLPPTATRPWSRTVAAEVDRAVRARSDDRCPVPFCPNRRFLHRSHRVPHREGSAREASDLDLLCDWHHFLYEIGELVPSGPPGACEWRDRRGRPLSQRRTYLPRRLLPLPPPSVRGPPPGGGGARAGGESPRAEPEEPP